MKVKTKPAGKVRIKPAKRKIVVALLGMCLAVSSYIVPPAKASPTRAQANPTMQSATFDAPSQMPFADPLFFYYYGYYYYYYYPYYYSYYYPYVYYSYYPYYYYQPYFYFSIGF
jgi:hypothetical protein